MGVLGQPESNFGQRHAKHHEPIYRSTVPKLGEPDEPEESKIEDQNRETSSTEANPRETGSTDGEVDKWELRGDYLVRKHCVPRTALYIPDADCPLRQEWLDLYRTTKTSLPAQQEASIRDIWRPDVEQPVLSSPWIGETIFELRRPRCEAGFEWQNGRKTKLQKTNRPPSVWPEVWKYCLLYTSPSPRDS